MSNPASNDPSDRTNSSDPKSVEGLFLAVLELEPGAERQAFLDEHCGDDADLRLRIVALLSAYDDAGSFLQRPISGLAETQSLDLSFLEHSDDPGLLGMLGQYEVYELIGRGGMGMVFRARDPKLNRVVAIKVLAPELTAHANARLRFLREAQAAAAISHPHVVTIFAVEDQSDAPGHKLPFIVMECIVGQTLQQKIDKQGSLRLTEMIRISQQVAEGLAAAHKQGLIHRDIKPANILLENGVERVKVSDFGLARAVDDMTITRTGEVSGTPQYMSPEQASGERVDHRSDLFSLGCVMYAMCTGRSPFRATSFAAAIKRVCQDTPRDVCEINQEIPGWVSQLVNQLLEKAPADRPDSATAVAVQLEEWLAAIQRGEIPVPSNFPHADSHPTSAQDVVGSKDVEQLPQNVRNERSTHQPSDLKSNVPPFTAVRQREQVNLKGLLAAFAVAIAPLAGALCGLIPVEFGIVFSMMTFPIGVYLVIQNCPRGHWLAEGCFFLMCVLFGPIGILLYIAHTIHKRDKSPAQFANTLRANPLSQPQAGAAAKVEPHQLVPDNSRLHSIVGGYLLRAGVFVIAAMLSLLVIGPGWTEANSIQWFDWDRQYTDLLGMGNQKVKDFAANYAFYAVVLASVVCAVGYVLRYVLNRTHRDANLRLWNIIPFVGLTLVVVMVLTWFEMSIAENCCLGLVLGLILYLMHCGLRSVIRRPLAAYTCSSSLILVTLLGGWIYLYLIHAPLAKPSLGFISPRSIDQVLVNGRRCGTFSMNGTTWVNKTLRLGHPVKLEVITKDGRYFGHRSRMWFPHKLSQITFAKGQLSSVQARFDTSGDSQTKVSQVDWLTPDGPERQELDRSKATYMFPGPHHFRVRFNDKGKRKTFDHRLDLAANKTYVIDFDKVVADYLGNDAASEVAEVKVVSPPTEPRVPQPREPVSKSDLVKRLGRLQIDINDDGMRVAIRRKSAFADAGSSPFVAGTEQQVTKFGQTQLDLHPGDYEIRIKDRRFGWAQHADKIREVTINDKGLETIVVDRNLPELKAAPKDISSSEFVDFIWNGTKSFTPTNNGQAAVVNALMKRIHSNTDALTLAELEGIYIKGWPPNFLLPETAFDDYWRKRRPDCIVPGVKKGTWRLAPVPSGTLKIVIRGSWLRGDIVAIDESSTTSPRVFFDSTNKQREFDFKLPPGDYQIKPEDLRARWKTYRPGRGMVVDDNDLTPMKPITITLKNGITKTAEIADDYERLASFSRKKSGIGHEVIVFQWTTNFGLEIEQELVVKTLLRRLANGQIEINEQELLDASNIKDTTIEKLFCLEDLGPGYAHIDRSYAKLICPGKTEGTWRLAPVPTATSTSDESNRPATSAAETH